MRILSGAEMYGADDDAIKTFGIPSEMLMENAGQAITCKLMQYLKPKDTIVVLAGAGNNGGDGIVVARRLRNLGYQATLVLAADAAKLKGAAKFHLDCYHKHRYPVEFWEKAKDQIESANWIVDALLGIGCSGDLRFPYSEIIPMVNRSKAKVFSIDTPSGVAADGQVSSSAVVADVTATIAYPKLSAYLYPAAEYYGEWETVDIGIPPQACCHAEERFTWELEDFLQTLPNRKPSDHKGDAGRAVVVGGSKDYTGAPILCAKACCVSGIGLLRIAAPNASRAAAAVLLPEATYLSCEEEDGHLTGLCLPKDVDVVACGPGLSRHPQCAQIVEQVLNSEAAVVLDADALYFLSDQLLGKLAERKSPVVLTPHEGEMARLCGCTPEHVHACRFSLSRAKAIEWNCVIVLKGPHTIVSLPDGRQFVNTSGNEGLAKGGSGDALTGIIAAFLPCHALTHQAVCNAVYAHGAAADSLLRAGRTTRDLLASDVIDQLPAVFDIKRQANNK